jgi:two-component system, LytTR family, response regulator
VTDELATVLPTRLRCVIVDDEPLSRRAMRQLLDGRDDVVVVGEHASALGLDPTASDADVLFLDIEMPARSGIDLAAELARGRREAPRPLVVFVTAHDEYAVKAFDTDAVDYLTKPVSSARLARALARVHERLLGGATRAPEATRSVGEPMARPPETMVVRVGNRDVVVPLADVALLEADGVYTALYVRGRRYLVRRSLHDLEQTLGASDFLRVHRSYLVRRSAITEVRPARSGAHRELVLASGAVVPVSRRQHAVVARALSEWRAMRAGATA